MRYWIIFACCLLTTPLFSRDQEAIEEFFLSTPEQIATLTSESGDLVGGLISPLSGQLALKETDLIAKGAQDIALSRIYIPPYVPCSFSKHKSKQKEWEKYDFYQHMAHHYKGWQFYPHLKMQLTPRLMEVLITDHNGSSFNFRLSGPHYSVAKMVSPSHALSNVSNDTPSGKYDSRNTRISYEDNGSRITAYLPDGGVRFYHRSGKVSLLPQLYLLKKEILPNGKVLRYHYDSATQPAVVESMDPKERFVYASIRIQGSPWNGSCHFTSSSGMTADYHYQRRGSNAKIKDRQTGKMKYNFIFPPILTSVSSPFYRQGSLDYCDKFLLNTYSGKEDIFKIYSAGFGEHVLYYRAHQLLFPVGNQDAFVPVYELTYDPAEGGEKEGVTTIKSLDGTSVVYHYSKNLLTTMVQFFGQDGNLKKEKVYSWDERNWLRGLEIRDAQGDSLYKKSYEYDRFGNPILEILSGDLTGEGNLDSFTIRRAFSEDGRNLLLKEEREDGKYVSYTYLPNTNLVTSKFTKAYDRIRLREFSFYDDCYNLIQTISDDGASADKDNLFHVTERHVTTYTLRQSAPFLHMPEWIEETCLEDGTLKLLKRSHLIYDQQGNVAQEEVYDAEGRLSFTICKTYNERGDVLSETNRLGQEAVYTYDAKGHLNTLTNFSHRLHKTIQYDIKGRLRKQEEKGDDGILHLLSSDYDLHDRLVLQKDQFQNATAYTYDPLVSKVAKTDFPPIASVNDDPMPVATFATYDPFGRELTKIDPNGNTTYYRYNAYSLPVEILHPNGGREHFRYSKNSKLISHTDPDGLTIRYENDVLGRVLLKTYIAQDGTTLAEEAFTYSGFHLLTETDKEGNHKRYTYDGAGRKTREEFCGRIAEFSYDPLGRLNTICKHNGDNTLLIHYKRDLEGRILEERKTGISGITLHKIAYSYDADGNQASVTHFIHGQEAEVVFTYDSFGRQIEEQDAEGNVYQTIYDENALNPLGQRVLQKKSIDPRQMTTIETQDAYSRTARKEVLNPLGAILASQEMTYDPQGNLLFRKDHLYENDQFLNAQTIKYTYTRDHQIESLIQGFGTKNARETTYGYSLSGKIAFKAFPDGVRLVYWYHPLGWLQRLDSVDGKIHHMFEYDRLGHLIAALDENQNIAIQRQVDPFGNVLQEKFSCGMQVQKSYDDFNRLISLKMANQGEVLYSYDPLYLRGVTRISPEGEALYTHTYDKYDESGNLISESLIGSLGQVIHTTDHNGRRTSLSSSYFSQECSYDSVGNLITTTTDGVESLYTYDGLSQLTSENPATYAHDSLYNRTQKNGIANEISDLNELLSFENGHCQYDPNGNQILKQIPSKTLHFAYDPLQRLIEVISDKKKINFVYDPLGRRLSKVVWTSIDGAWKEPSRELYLYHGQNEIGAFASQEFKNLKILGLAPIAVELKGQAFAPLLDVQGNIRRLINPAKRTLAASYDFTAFGEELPTSQAPLSNPWRFASKRLDPELGLIYFGKRYYDPQLARWLTTDPAGFYVYDEDSGDHGLTFYQKENKG